jgi:hypothetical protein
MFTSNSRYYNTPQFTFETADGREVSVVCFPIRNRPALIGYHRREEGQRLDLVAAFYLKDATRFWRLCDANAAISPHALETHALIGIPVQGS